MTSGSGNVAAPTANFAPACSAGSLFQRCWWIVTSRSGAAKFTTKSASETFRHRPRRIPHQMGLLIDGQDGATRKFPTGRHYSQ